MGWPSLHYRLLVRMQALNPISPFSLKAWLPGLQAILLEESREDNNFAAGWRLDWLTSPRGAILIVVDPEGRPHSISELAGVAR